MARAALGLAIAAAATSIFGAATAAPNPNTAMVPRVVTAPCNDASAAGAWSFTPDGTWRHSTADGAQCVRPNATSVAALASAQHLLLAACDASDDLQRWSYDAATGRVALAAAPVWSAVIDMGHGGTAGSAVNIYDTGAGTSGAAYCRAHGTCAFADSGGTLRNNATGLCAGVSSPMPTCAQGSPSASQQFCNTSLTFEARAAALVAQLTQSEKLQLWTVATMTSMIPRLNVKGFNWDSTCIHGPPFTGVTVFPHAINQGATFDADMVYRMGNATATEMRAYTQLAYAASGGTIYEGLSCDGGPLANNAHDPRWGRISETYGEDPYVISQLGVAATVAMQNPSVAVTFDDEHPTAGAAADGRVFLATSQTTRHYLGYHQANDMQPPQINVTERELRDTYLPPYESFQVDGRAEGIMCGYASFDGVPSCADKRLLQTILKGEWGSGALVQSDCCNSIESIATQHHYVDTLEEAVTVATQAGTQLCFRCGTKEADAFAAAIEDGMLTSADLDAAVTRVMLTRFRLGEFEPGPHPFSAVNTSLLDCPAHRQLARESAAASVVLAQNNGNLLPLPTAAGSAIRRIAVVGPFAHCNDTDKTNCYLHSYNGVPSSIVTVLDAVRENAVAMGATVTYEQGTQATTNSTTSSIAAAAAAAAASDVTIAVLGLGNKVEREGFDRSALGFPTVQQQLLTAVRGAAKPGSLVVVTVSAGGVSFNTTQADAILYAGYGGEEAGHGVSDVLFGAVNPSARMPVTVYAADYLSHVGPMLDYHLDSGVGRTYRYLDTAASPPVFWFGFGLSFSSWQYSGLRVSTPTSAPSVNVTFAVANTGGVDGHEVVQVYVSVPTVPGLVTPVRSLRAFARPHVAAGAAVDMAFTLAPADLRTVLNDGSTQYTRGTYTVSVGGHQPGDPRGEAVSPSLSATFTL